MDNLKSNSPMKKITLFCMLLFCMVVLVIHLSSVSNKSTPVKIFNSKTVMCANVRDVDKYKLNDFLDHSYFLNISKIHLHHNVEGDGNLLQDIALNYRDLGYDIQTTILTNTTIDMMWWECMLNYVYDDLYDYIMFVTTDDLIMPSNTNKYEITTLLEDQSCTKLPVVKFKVKDITGTTLIKDINTFRMKDGVDIYENDDNTLRDVRHVIFKSNGDDIGNILYEFSKSMIVNGSFGMDNCARQNYRNTLIGNVNNLFEIEDMRVVKDTRLLQMRHKYV